MQATRIRKRRRTFSQRPQRYRNLEVRLTLPIDPIRQLLIPKEWTWTSDVQSGLLGLARCGRHRYPVLVAITLLSIVADVTVLGIVALGSGDCAQATS